MGLIMLIEEIKVFIIITFIFGFIINGILSLTMIVTTGYIDPKLMFTMLFFLIAIIITFLTAFFPHLVKENKRKEIEDEDDVFYIDSLQ